MRLPAPRIPALRDDELTDEQREQLDATQKLNIFRTLVNHPKLMKRWTVFANHVLYKSSLPPRDREILILRIGFLCRSEYEWGQHVRIGRREGLTAEEIDRIKEGPDASGWDPFDAALVRAADELHAGAFVTDATWAALSGRYDMPQLMDVVFTVGQYALVSMALNSFGVQLEDGVRGFE